MMMLKTSMRPLLLATIPITMLLAPLSSLAASSDSSSSPSAEVIDPESGMIIADGWQLTKANCTVCHSARLVTQNNGSRVHWESLIRWMQETQGLWQFQPEMETTILDYLTENYGPKSDARRTPLLPSQLPDNPYNATHNEES